VLDLVFLYFISSDIGNFSSNFNFFGPLRFCMAGFGLFELGLELAALGPLFLLFFLVIHSNNLCKDTIYILDNQ
jgi:hypothetical protein